MPRPPIHDRLQNSFLRHGAAQCGACTPGMLVSATALLERNSAPGERSHGRDRRSALPLYRLSKNNYSHPGRGFQSRSLASGWKRCRPAPGASRWHGQSEWHRDLRSRRNPPTRWWSGPFVARIIVRGFASAISTRSLLHIRDPSHPDGKGYSRRELLRCDSAIR